MHLWTAEDIATRAIMATLRYTDALHSLVQYDHRLSQQRSNGRVHTVSPASAAEIEEAASKAASATAALTSVLHDARVLSDSLLTLHAAAEGAVRNMRQLDTQKQSLQRVLNRVDDMLDLRSCLAGAQQCLAEDDDEGLATHIRQFKSVRTNLAVPTSDEEFMAEAEERLVQRTLADLDRAMSDMTVLEKGRAGVVKCCQLLALLGRGGDALHRFVRYVGLTLRRECVEELVALATAAGSTDKEGEGGHASIEGTAVAVNVLSALFTHAVQALDGVAGETAALLGAELGQGSVLQQVHAAVQWPAAQLVRSFTRSARMQAALHARETLLQEAAGAGAQASSGSSSTRASHTSSDQEYSTPTSASYISALLRAIEGERLGAHGSEGQDQEMGLGRPGVDAPFAAPADAVLGVRVNGQDMSVPQVLDAFLDESALMLQRCVSYFRLLHARVAAAQSGSSSASGGSSGGRTSDGGAAMGAVEDSIKARGELASSVAGLAGAYAAVETGALRHAVYKAVSLDEPFQGGAHAAGVDILSLALHVGPRPAGLLASASTALMASAAAASEGGGSGSPGGTGPGPGLPVGGAALCGTVVEDCGYVLRRAAQRALATGNTEAATSVLASLGFCLEQQVLQELEWRVKLSLLEQGSTEYNRAVQAFAMPPQAQERLQALRRGLGAFAVQTVVNSGLLEAYALFGLPSFSGRGSSSGATSTAPALGAGSAGLDMGNAGSGPAGGLSSASSLARAGKLTDDVALLCYGLVGMQLAVEVTERLHAAVLEQAADVFPEAREGMKVRDAASGLGDAAVSLRRTLDTSLSALVTRLTPRLRSSLSVFEGTASLVQYDISEEQYEALTSGFSSSTSGGDASGVSGGDAAGGAGRGGGAQVIIGPDGSLMDVQGGSGGSHRGNLQVLNPFTTEFLPTLAGILAPYASCLTPSLASALTLRVSTYIARQLEPRLRRKKFTAWGALLLDSDLRALVTLLHVRSGDRRVRERCNRLLTISALLNVDRPSEALEVLASMASPAPGAEGLSSPPGAPAASAVGGGGLEPELTGSEAREVLRLRVDFSSAAIEEAVPLQ